MKIKILTLLLLLCSLFSFGTCLELPEETSDETSVNTLYTETSSETSLSYVLNKNTKKFHLSECYAIQMMNEENKIFYEGNRNEIIQKGYKPCAKCNP